MRNPVAAGTFACTMARTDTRTDTRFTAIDDAVALLKLLPPVGSVAWPTDPGDQEVVADGLRWLAAWTPAANAAFKRHRRDVRRLPEGDDEEGG